MLVEIYCRRLLSMGTGRAVGDEAEEAQLRSITAMELAVEG